MSSLSSTGHFLALENKLEQFLFLSNPIQNNNSIANYGLGTKGWVTAYFDATET